MRALYLEESINICDCCGKTGLKHTVAMLADSGGLYYYGTTCAARNTGKTAQKIRDEIAIERGKKEKEEAGKIAAAQSEFEQTNEFMELEEAKQCKMVGANFFAHCAPYFERANNAARAIEERNGLKRGALYV